MWFENLTYPCLVVCTSKRHSGLTVNKTYKALDWFYDGASDDYYLNIIDDEGVECGYAVGWFKYNGGWSCATEFYQADPDAGQF